MEPQKQPPDLSLYPGGIATTAQPGAKMKLGPDLTFAIAIKLEVDPGLKCKIIKLQEDDIEGIWIL